MSNMINSKPQFFRNLLPRDDSGGPLGPDESGTFGDGGLMLNGGTPFDGLNTVQNRENESKRNNAYADDQNETTLGGTTKFSKNA